MTNEQGINYYSFPELLELLIKQFSLPKDASFKKALREKVSAICKSIPDVNDPTKNLYTIAAERGNKLHGSHELKQFRYFFSESEVTQLMKNASLRNYLLKSSSDEYRKEYIDNEDEAEIQNIADQEFFGSLDMDDMYENEKIPYISDEELITQKMRYMLEALFLKFFTPIDESKLRDDMETLLYTMPMHNTAESVAALKRLNSPAGNAYYQKIASSTDTDTTIEKK